MAAVIGSPQGFQELFTNISLKFNPTESEDVVQSLKRNYGGKFNSLDNQDLLSSLHLLLKHGFVSDNKLTLIEEFVALKSKQKEQIKEMIKSFKESREQQIDPDKELPGRRDEIKEITKKLETKGQSLIVNLFGSAGVGKTTLARIVCSKWRGKYFVCDLREAKDMKAIYLNMMSSLGLNVPIGYVDQNSVVTKVHENIQVLNQPVLFLLDNVEQFTAGQGKEGKNLKTAFVQFLEGLSEYEGKDKDTSLKLLLTSRNPLEDAKSVDNFSVKSLESFSSEKILVSNGMINVNTQQKDELIGISEGKPLLLKGLAAILRQERKSPNDLIAKIQESKLEEDAKEELFNFEEEELDEGQFSTIREMFNSLPTDSLKVSAVSISLFCGPFSVTTAAEILGISPENQAEALAQLEGLVTSAIISVVNENAKDRLYDIHPLLRKYADSIKEDGKFHLAYLEAKRRFHQHFMAKMEKIAELIEHDYVSAFQFFETDRANYEFTVEISLQPQYFRVPGDFRETALIASLFNAMLTEDKQIKLFHSWAEMCNDDGESGSLCRAQLKCREARQVLDVKGTEKAFEILNEAFCSLEKVRDKSSESYRLSKGLHLYSEGEMHYRNRDYTRSIESLERSSIILEKLLRDHTDLARCYNAIGNCHFWLSEPKKALHFYNKAYEMQKKLARSENHFDMPVYKNQIGTVYESQEKYDKAIKCYNEALHLLDELKISGFWDEALLRRNLANALMFQGKYSDAVKPAEIAYSIRKKLNGNHPETVRSLYQLGMIQANLENRSKALELFLTAWEMEKSLGAGNHSEVWRLIITRVEEMCDDLNKGEKKKQFLHDALKFCRHFWEEQKSSKQFRFTKYNKDIFDAIVYLLGDKTEKYGIEKSVLLLDIYEGLLSVTEKQFQERFEQETSNTMLNEMMKERDEILERSIELSCELDERKKLLKFQRSKLALYEMALVRRDFVGKKKNAFDKAKLKSTVEELYKYVGQEKNIPEFRKNLLSTWQTQWEEEKSTCTEMTKKIGLAKEETINGILQLCKELNKEDMYRRYGEEGLLFKEELWEVTQATMHAPEKKKFLRDIKKLASSIGDHRRENIYHEAYQALQDGEKPEATIRSNVNENLVVLPVKEIVSEYEEKDDGKEEEEEEIEVDLGDETDTSLSINRKTLIKRGEVSHEGDIWNLQEAAASITFCRGADTKPLLIACSLWSPRTLSPPLGSNEVLVSNVIELSHDGPPDLEFRGDAQRNITVALMHSACDLKGYEVVIKQLVDPESNEWTDLETDNFWHTSAKSTVHHWLFPFAEAACTVTRYSSFAAIWRLKPFIFRKPKTVNAEFTCTVPDYPDVSVSIPWNSVPAVEDFCLTLKVQEPPSIGPDGDGMLVGPVLHISSSDNVELLEPAKITIPLTFFQGKREFEDIRSGEWTILHNSREKSQQWTEDTVQLVMPPALTDGIVTFQVKHFCRIWPWWSRRPSHGLSERASNLSSREQGQRAGFLACLCDKGIPSDYLLTLSCFPTQKKKEAKEDIYSTFTVQFQGQGTSLEPLCKEDKAFVSLSEAFSLQESGNTEDLYLLFLGDEPFDRSWPVKVRELSDLRVDFYKLYMHDGQKRRQMLCTLHIIPRAQQVPLHPSLQTVLHSEPRLPMASLRQDIMPTLEITLLGDEWGSLAGGLSTLNRELAIKLAKQPNVEVTLLVPENAQITDEHKKMANSLGITVAEAKKLLGYEDPLDWLSSPPDDLTMDVVIGHGMKLGRQGQVLRKSKSCQWVQMVHTAQEQLGIHKRHTTAISEAGRKHQIEVDLCKLADLVVPVGPKLEEAYSSCLRCEEGKDIFVLTPGIFEEFVHLKQHRNESSEFKVLLCGRGDSNIFEQKGYDIGVKAFADQELNEKPYRLLFVGAPDGKEDEVAGEFLKFGIAKTQLTVRKFVNSRDKMKDLFCEADLAIMPSITEGFGLIALEALSAGLPLLVSGNSGFAKALRAFKIGNFCIVDSKEPKDWAKKIKSVCEKHGEWLQDIKALRESYGKMYSWENQCKDLVEKLRNMVHGMN